MEQFKQDGQFDPISASISANTKTTIAVTVPSNTTGVFRLRLKANSVYGNSRWNPPTAITSPPVSVGNISGSLTYSERIQFTYPAGIQAIHARCDR